MNVIKYSNPCSTKTFKWKSFEYNKPKQKLTVKLAEINTSKHSKLWSYFPYDLISDCMAGYGSFSFLKKKNNRLTLHTNWNEKSFIKCNIIPNIKRGLSLTDFFKVCPTRLIKNRKQQTDRQSGFVFEKLKRFDSNVHAFEFFCCHNVDRALQNENSRADLVNSETGYILLYHGMSNPIK